jgi:hypothetical protein
MPQGIREADFAVNLPQRFHLARKLRVVEIHTQQAEFF